MGEKRKINITDEVPAVKRRTEGTNIVALDPGWKNIYDHIVNSSTAEVTEVEATELTKSLKENQYNAAWKSEVNQTVNFHFLSTLLTSYSACRTRKDYAIYECLNLLETVYGVDLSIIQPLVWGERSRKTYEMRRQFGTSLHRTQPDDIISYLDGERMWRTVRNHSRSDKFTEDTYDVRFLLRVFAQIIHPGSELSCRVFVEFNCLSLAFSCTSAKETSIRKLAYLVLQKYLSLLQELSVSNFPEKSIFLYLLRLFKQSIETEAPRMSHMTSHFLARVSKLLLHPESPIYGPILAFLCLKPLLDVNNVPELYKMLFSYSTKHHKVEREWILTLISEGMIEPMDYNILQNRFGIKLLQSLFASCLSDQTCRRLILATFKAAVSMPSVAHDLFHRVNLHGWIAAVICSTFLSKWEQNYLAQIFCILISNEREYNRRKVSDPTVALCSAKIAARAVSDALKQLAETENISQEHLSTIEEVLGKKWRMKKRKGNEIST